MKCNSIYQTIRGYLFVLISAGLSLTCSEKLPTYVFPDKVMSMNVTLIEQLNDKVARPGRQMVHMVLEGRNIFDEVFWDSVDFKGSVRVWWKRKPSRFRTITLTKDNLTNPSLIQSGKMMLLPNQSFAMNVFWNMKSDDSLYLPFEMNFDFLTRRTCSANVACADPEEFVVEVSLNAFDRLGYVSAPAKTFTFVARACIICGSPPCPPPPGGCG